MKLFSREFFDKQFSAMQWGWIFAVAGFAAGFLGPMLLNPQANQGPMLGIFITGPGGLLLGVILGALCNTLPLSVAHKFQILISIAGLAVLTILYFCLPSPEKKGYVLEAEIQQCLLATVVIDAKIKEREASAAKYSYYQPRSGWQAEMRQKAVNADGVVLEVRILRKRHVYEHQQPWNKGEITLDTWQTVSEKKYFYARQPGACAPYLSASRGIYHVYSDTGGSTLWPPENLAAFLALDILDIAPQEYLQP